MQSSVWREILHHWKEFLIPVKAMMHCCISMMLMVQVSSETEKAHYHTSTYSLNHGLSRWVLFQKPSDPWGLSLQAALISLHGFSILQGASSSQRLYPPVLWLLPSPHWNS